MENESGRETTDESAHTAEGTAVHSFGRLEALLGRGDFAVTAETMPPLSSDPEAVRARTLPLRGIADAVNVTDGAGARARMSALATAAIMAANGVEPVLQMTVRDRNRLALQADLLGGAALGVPNILCLYGDSITTSDQPDARAVNDLDSAQLIAMAVAMRDDGVLPTGRRIAVPPRLFVGAADTPEPPGRGWSSAKLRAKIDAGANFIQTQLCFEIAVIRAYIARLRDEGLTERAHFLIGFGPLASARSARWMRDNLFGVSIPDAIIDRLERAADPREEGIRVCVELIQQVAEIPGAAGAHLMAPRQEEAMAEAITRAGIRERQDDATPR